MRALKSIIFLVASFGAAHAALTTDTLSGVQFGKTVFSPGDQSSEPALFIAAFKAIAEPAAGAKDIRPYALSRVALSGDSATISPMAADPTSEGWAGTSINGRKITNLDLLNKRYPVLTVDGETDSSKIIAVMDPYSGSQRKEVVVKDSADPAVEINKPIAGLTASDKYIFVAVPKANFAFEKGTENGIAVIKWDETAMELKTLDATDLQAAVPTAKAAYLDVSPNGGYVSFTDDAEVSPIAGALIGKTTAMCWDDVLQRLYIGFSYATRDSVDKNGGIFGVAMGLIDKDLTTQKDKVFKLYPIVYTPKKDLFFNTDLVARAADIKDINVLDRMIGFYFDAAKKKTDINVLNDGTDDISIQIPFVKTMHTSTGKHYLIVASKISYAPMSLFPIATSGGTMVLNIQDGIYALPLIPNDDNLAPNKFADSHGVIALVDNAKDGVVKLFADKYEFPKLFADMPTKAQAPAKVCGDEWITDISHVYDISVVGDTVYIAFGGGIDPWNRGVYATTAFFNSDGFIRGWTPVKRVMGSVTHAYGLGLDANRGNFYFLGPKAGSTDTLPTTGYITQWGKSRTGVSTNTAAINSDTSIDDPTSLSTVLAKMFPSDKGGVYRTATFDEWTPGFEPDGKFSMMIAVGYDKIALIETGKDTGAGFMPTEKFVVGTNVRECSDAELKKIAPLYCATVACDSTDPDNKHAYAFVGGYGGVVKADLGTNFSGSPIGAFAAPIISDPVLSLLPGKSGGEDVVCALTNKKVYIHSVLGVDFAAGQVSEIPVPGAIDFVVARKTITTDSVVIVGTTSGLKAFDLATGGPADITNNVKGQVVQLQYLSQDQVGVDPNIAYSTPSTPGMVYAWVLGKKIEEEAVIPPGETFDPSKTYPAKHVIKDVIVPQLYRFAVDDEGDLAAIDTFTDDKIFAGSTNIKDLLTGARPVLQLDTFESGFFTDGSSVFYTASKSIDNADFARVFPLSYTKTFTNKPTVADDLSLMYNLALDDSNYYIGRGGIEPASGKKYFCGDFGIRVNE